jgi:chemotaxis protein CheD
MTMANAGAETAVRWAGRGRQLNVGIAEWALSAGEEDHVVTHALGSCVAVCIWDPVTRVGGLLHFLLPDSKLNPARAHAQPGAFADTGIPVLLRAAGEIGCSPRRAVIRLIGGATMNNADHPGFDIGKRNVLAARSLLWRHGLFVSRELVGGAEVRTVRLLLATGKVIVTNGPEFLEEL